MPTPPPHPALSPDGGEGVGRALHEIQARLASVLFLLFHGDVAADDAFELAVLGSEQQRAVGVQRFGVTVDFTVADVNRNALANGGAMFFPFLVS